MTWGATTITPDAGSNVLEKIKSDYLWDPTATPLPYDQPLYAIWSDTVTVTFDIARIINDNELHIWTGPATTTTPGLRVYYRNPEENYLITYTMAKGETVPMPLNPTTDPTNPDVAEWVFLTWVKLNNNTDFARNTAIEANNGILVPDIQNPERENRFDFAKPVTQDITLIPCWTAIKTQIYTFTVENEVIGGWLDDEFDYTIAVTDVQVIGKRNSNSNTTGAPTQTWGKPETDLTNNTSKGSNSVTTKLKRNETYTVRITVSKISAYGGNYGIEIAVIDRNNTVIKTGHLIYCVNNGNKNFASDLKYTFWIYQDEKPFFTQL